MERKKLLDDYSYLNLHKYIEKFNIAQYKN